MCGNPYKVSVTFSNKSPNLDRYWEIITTIGVAISIANIEVTVAAVKEPNTPDNAPPTELPWDNPRINQYPNTPTGNNKLKNISTKKKASTRIFVFFESLIFINSLGVPETFADLEISLPLCAKLIINARKINTVE